MAEDAITFSELRKIQKQESRQEELTELDDSFVLKVADYLETKKEVSGEGREYRNAKRVFDKIIGLREEKIVKNARLAVKSGVDASELNLLPTEQQLFLDMKEQFSEHRDRLDDRIDSGMVETPDLQEPEKSDEGDEEEDEAEESEDEDELEDEEDEVVVKITSEVPEFMGTDLETYGPFEEGEEAEVPKENAEILINRGNAEKAE